MSKSIFSLDLSRNPNLQITKTSLEKFTDLAKLKLEFRSLHVAFKVPYNVRRFYLSKNELNCEQFYTMFSKASLFLRLIDVSFNNMHMDTR